MDDDVMHIQVNLLKGVANNVTKQSQATFSLRVLLCIASMVLTLCSQLKPMCYVIVNANEEG